MKTTEFKTTRLTATTPEEKRVRESWGRYWNWFGVRERSGKPILLIFGDWSGYRSSQYRITHIDFAGFYGKQDELQDGYRGTVKFTDNTTMAVWVRAVTRAQMLEQKYERREGYTKLIGELINSGKSFYAV